MSRTNLFQRCGCKDQNTGRLLGGRCQKLGTEGHGWYFSAELPATAGKRRRVRRGGYPTRQEAVEAARRWSSATKGGRSAAMSTGEFLTGRVTV